MYRPKTKLTNVIATTLALATSGCYELAADVMGTARGYSNDSTTRILSGVVERGLTRKGQEIQSKKERAQSRQEKYEDVDVDLYRERKFRALEDELNPPQEEISEATQKTIDKLLGKEEGEIDYRQLVNKIEERCREDLSDYERNVRTIDRTLALEELTKDDKNKLAGLLGEMVWQGAIEKRIGLRTRLFILFSREKGVLFDYILNRQETSPQLRISIMQTYSLSLPYHIKFQKFSKPEAVELLKDKIEVCEKMKKEVELSKPELKATNKTLAILKKYLRKYSK